MGQRRKVGVRAGAALVAGLLLALVPPSAAAPAERIDARCEQDRAGAWVHFTQGQSFTPVVGEITAVEVRLVQLKSFKGTLPVRLAQHPVGEQQGLLTPGRVLFEGRLPVDGPTQVARWLRVKLPTPVRVEKLSARTVYAVHVDFPVAPEPKDSPVAWMTCGRLQDGMRAWVTGSADFYDRASSHPEQPTSPVALPRDPLLGTPHPSSPNLQFRVLGR